MKHLHNFDTIEEFNSVKNNLKQPYIAFINENNSLTFNTNVTRLPEENCNVSDVMYLKATGSNGINYAIIELADVFIINNKFLTSGLLLDEFTSGRLDMENTKINYAAIIKGAKFELEPSVITSREEFILKNIDMFEAEETTREEFISSFGVAGI